MRKNIDFKQNFAALFSLFIILCFSAEAAFSQCGTHFKSGYTKIINSGFLDYNKEFSADDWNNDGKLDFWRFELNTNISTQNVVVYLNNGSGDWNWNSPIVHTTTIPQFSGSQSYEPHLKDFDTDGDKDVLFISSFGFHSILYKNNGNGTFTASEGQIFQDATLMKTIGFTDLNGDNLLDWVNMSNRSNFGHAIGYRLANADGTFGDMVTIVVNGSAQNSSSLLLADFNGDGKPDIFYSNEFQYSLLTNTGGGNFTTGNVVALGERTYFVEAKDFNNDGRADIVAQAPANTPPANVNRKLYVYFGQANATFSVSELPIYSPAAFSASVTGEFNGDGFPDILELGAPLFSDPNVTPFYSVHAGNGAGGFTRTDYLRDLGQMHYFVFADFNGDTKTDIFVKGMDSAYLQNMFGEQLVSIRYNQCQPAGAVKKANFDSNDIQDLTIWNSTTGQWRSINGHWHNGRNLAMREFYWGSGALGDVPAPGDYDGDGKSDYAVYRSGEGNWYIWQSSNGAWLTVKFGLPDDIPVPNNYDGGEKTDIAVFRPSDGNWYILSSETQQLQIIHFGASGDKPVAQDYDGDGKTDVAVFRPSEGNWYYLKSSDQSYVVLHYGISTDKPVPADYDGDGKADIAVYRSPGGWYILRSSTNSSNFIQWGIANDIPVPIYTNGESASPVAYRPSSAVWYNFEKNNYGIVFGGNPFAPVYYGLPNN